MASEPTDTEAPSSAPSDAPEINAFQALGLNASLVQSLAALGYEEPTPIQRDAIPHLLGGRDVLGQAATGTGKTAAFALPLLQLLEAGKCGPFETSALILVPTRELAMQVAEAVYSYGKVLDISVLPVYGGQEFTQQVTRLKRGIDVIVATPGRALDHLRRKTLKLDKVRSVVLDEADEMLDLGFAEDLEAILSQLPPQRQTALFSATLPPRIAGIAERHLKNPVRIQIAREKPIAGEVPRVRQTAYIVARNQKGFALRRLLDSEDIKSAIIFCRTRTEVDELTDALLALGARAEPLHGGMTQEQRERVLKRFRGEKADLLVATDVAARGLHVDKLSHVFNYDLPTAPEAYVHRIGRTGRAGSEGVAISLVEPRERRLLGNIERLTRQKIEIAQLPTVEDLEARKLEQLRESLRAVIDNGELDAYRGVVEALAREYPLQDVAAAAVKLGHLGATPPEAPVEEAPAAAAHAPSAPGGMGEEAGKVRLFINQGRMAGVRPGDIVGMLANEANVPGADVGAIEIHDRHSTVEVKERYADPAIEALKDATLRGKRVKLERDRGPIKRSPPSDARPPRARDDERPRTSHRPPRGRD